MSFGKFIFLYFLGRNVDYFVFKCILERLTESSEDDHLDDLLAKSKRVTAEQLSRQLSMPGIVDFGETELDLPDGRALEEAGYPPDYNNQDTLQKDTPL